MADRTTSTHPRRIPKQARSRALVDAMLTATARVLMASDPEAMTTNEVARVAGVSIGSLYQYFPSKEALLAALLERELDADLTLARDLLGQHQDTPLRDALALFLDALIVHTASRAALHARLLPMVAELERDTLVREARQGMWDAFDAYASRRLDELPAGWEDPAVRRRGMWMLAAALEAAFNAVKVQDPEALGAPDVRAMLLGLAEAGLRASCSRSHPLRP